MVDLDAEGCEKMKFKQNTSLLHSRSGRVLVALPTFYHSDEVSWSDFVAVFLITYDFNKTGGFYILFPWRLWSPMMSVSKSGGCFFPAEVEVIIDTASIYGSTFMFWLQNSIWEMQLPNGLKVEIFYTWQNYNKLWAGWLFSRLSQDKNSLFHNFIRMLSEIKIW